MATADHDGAATAFPVSAKGILLREDRVLLVDNPRGEWELPGGKLERDEDLAACVAREIEEELGVAVRVGPVVDAWLYRIAPACEVVVVAFGCEPLAWPAALASPEGKAVGLFRLAELDALRLPEGYRAAIRRFAATR